MSSQGRAGAPGAQAGVLLPDLRFFPASSVLLHEEEDPPRVDRLVGRLREEGVLRNPPLAAELGDGRVVILDGANRVTALQRMGAVFVLVQVVPYHDPGVVLDRWHHLLQEVPDGLVEHLRREIPLQPERPERAPERLARGELLAYLRQGEGAWAVPRSEALTEGAWWLRSLVASYRGRVPYHRVDSEDVELLSARYGQVRALVAFGRFSKSDILELARNAAKLPAGVTRHVVPGRALRVNLPLKVAFGAGTLEEKNAWLADWVRWQVREGRVRYYPEPTVLFDE